jgi:hypothetical protein
LRDTATHSGKFSRDEIPRRNRTLKKQFPRPWTRLDRVPPGSQEADDCTPESVPILATRHN